MATTVDKEPSSTTNDATPKLQSENGDSGVNKDGLSVDSDYAPPQAGMGYKSYGVARVEAMTALITFKDRIAIFSSIFILSYVFTLDGTLRYAYQPYATASFSNHSLLSTINVLRAVIGAAFQPTAAKIADVFGRLELILVAVFFYAIGTVVQAVANNIDTFSAGIIIYQVGFTIIQLLMQVLIADITSTRSRLVFSFLPATPFLINTWVSGDISEAVLSTTTWRWGIGMWGIILPVCSIPLIAILWIIARRARKAGVLDQYKTPFQVLGFRAAMIDLFWRLDIIGVILILAIFALILVPLTLAGGFEAQWSEAHIIAPIVVGVVCIPVFLFWQSRAPHPLVPFSTMKDRGIWAPMGVALLLNFAWYMQGNYLWTVLIVGFDMDITMATRVANIWTFVSTCVGFLLGFVVFKVRRLKYFMVAGTCFFLVAFGLLIHFRGDTDGANQAGIIGGQFLLGFGGGMFSYPAQASIQVSLKHEYLAVMTGIFLATYNVGSALGNGVAGAVWTQLLPSELDSRLSQFGNDTLTQLMYNDPFSAIYEYPVGTPERTEIIGAYRSVQRILCIIGICLAVPLLACTLLSRNHKLNDKQTLAKDSDTESTTRS